MNILLATDGSHFSQAAGHFLTCLPWPSNCGLTVLSVVDKLEWLPTSEKSAQEETPHDSQQLQHALQQDAQDILTREIDRFTALGWTPQPLVRQGHASNAIVSAAEELGTDVIALGSRGLSGIKRFLLGSVSEQVMTYAPCSVLIVRQPDDRDNGSVDEPAAQPGESDQPCRILLAYDGSPAAEAAVETLASMSLDEHAHILVTTVMTLMTYYRMDMIQTASPSWQAKKQAAQDSLEQIERRLRHLTPNIAVQLRESDDTSQEILDAAHDFDADLIVVGHRGQSGIERLLLGSVATQVVHHAPCSVWIIRQS